MTSVSSSTSSAFSGVTPTTHAWTMGPLHSQRPCGGTIHSWVYDGTEGPAGELRMQPRINLWIHRGGIVENPQEVIISSYTATPATGRRSSVLRRGSIYAP